MLKTSLHFTKNTDFIRVNNSRGLRIFRVVFSYEFEHIASKAFKSALVYF